MSFVRLPADKHMAGPLENQSSFWLAKAAIAKSFLNRKPPVNLDTRDSLSQIVSNLYLSSCHLEAQKDVLTRKGVTHILQVGKELSPTHPAAFTYKHIPVYDLEEEDLVKYFRECFDFINAGRENGAVLVHCAAGVSRSASVVIGYLMATGGLSLEDARAAVKAARPAINPNQGFLLQLQLFQDAGCSAEGWQQWDLERFLRVRSAAYSRRDTPAALVLDAAKSSGNLMRGACEVSPPTLSHEDSISPAGSPTHSPSRTTDGTQGPFFSHANITTAASAAVATTAPVDPAAATSTSSAVDHPGGAAALPSAGASRGGGFGRDGLMATGGASPEQEIMGMVANGGCARGSAGAAPCSQGAGGSGGSGRGNRMAGPSYRLPTLPAVGGAAAGVVMAAASATWAAIVGASSGGREAGGFWPPHSGPRPAPPLPASAPVVGAAAPVVAATPPTLGGPSPVPLPLSRSLQRQRSADDAVAPAIASMRAVATSLPSIGVVTVDATSNALGTMHSHTSNPSSNNSNTSLILAARHPTAAAAAVSPTSLPSRSCRPADGLITTRARTTSGTADASSLATGAAVQAHEGVQHLSGTPGSLPAWARPEAQPIASHTGQVPVSQGAGVDAGLDVWYRAGSASPMTTWPGAQQAHGDRVTSANSRGAGGGVGPDQGSIEVMPGSGAAVKHASYHNHTEGLYSTGGVPAADGTGTAVEMSTSHAPWLLEVTPSPPVQQPQRLSQRSIDAGGLPALSPIPSDVGSDEAGGSDADEGNGDVSGGIGADGRTGASERQWRAEDAVNPTQTVPQRGRDLLRRSFSDRLQGMLTRAYRDGIDTGDDGRENTPCSVGEAVGRVTMSQLSPFTKTTTAAVATPVTAAAAAAPAPAPAAGPSKGFGIGDKSAGSGKGNGIDDATLGVGLTDQPQLHQPQPMVAMTRMLFGGGVANLTASAVAAVDPATRRLCADSGVSSGLLAPFWPDVSASDASSSSNNNTKGTAASWMSGGEGGTRAGGGSIIEERSDASSSAVTVVAGRTENDCLAASQSTPWQDSPGLRTAVSVSPEEAAGGSGTARHQQHWTLLSILAPAGLERTPSKTPQTPVAAVGYDEAASEDRINGPPPQEGVADWMGLGPAWPEARTITPYDSDLADGSAAPAAAAARSTALKHLVAAQAFSYAGGANAVPAVAATTTLAAAAASAVGATPAASNTLHGRPNADILASRTSGSVGSSTGPPWSPQVGAYGDWYGPGRPPALAGSHCVHSDGIGMDGLLAGSQHTPKVPFATAAKAASRLATTTFADSTGGDDGSWDGQPTADQRCERGRSTSSSGVGHGYRGSEAAAISYNENTASAVTYGGRGEGEGDDGTRNVDGNNIGSMPSLRRRSAPVRMALGLQASSAGIAAAAALPPADPVSSPTPAPVVGGPVRSLRLSIRNDRGPNGSSGDGAGVPPADLGRSDGGSGTPIHKRVLRSLTFFLGRSSESPTGATDAASAVATGFPSQTEGLASGEEKVSGIDNNAQLAAVPVARRRLWSGMRAGGIAAPPPLGGAAGAADSGGGWQTAAEGIEVNRNVAGLHYLALKDQDATVTGASTTSAAQTQLVSIRDNFAGTAVRAAVQLPPAASTIISDAVHAPDSSGACAQPRQPSWAGGAALGAVYGNADGSASATMMGSWDEVNSNDDAAQVGVSQLRVLSRSTSCHPTCTTTAGTGDEVPLPVGIASVSEGTAGSRPIQAKVDKVEAEADGEEVVVDLDLLPNAPFHWDPSPVAEWLPGAVAPLATDIRSEGGWCEVLESTGLAAGVSKCGELNDGGATPLLASATTKTKTSAAAPAAAPVGPAGAAFNRNGARRFSLDGCKHEDDSSEADRLGPLWPKATRAVVSVGPGPGSMAAATTAAYLTNLMGVASAALLPVHSSSLQLEMAPPDTTTPALATPTAIAVTTTTSSQTAGPASAPVSAAIDAWWCTSDAAGGDVSGMQRSVSLGPQGLALPLPLGPATTCDQPPGRQVMATYGAAAAAARGSVLAPQAYDPAVNGSGSNNARTGPTPARQPRSSYSGAVSMQPPMSRHELEALLGAGTVDTGAPPQWQPHPTGTDKQQLPSESHTDTSRRSSQAHSLDHGPMPVPLTGTQPLPSATQQHTQQAVPYVSGAAGEGAGAASRPALPAWGGSRSSASLLTMPSDPESPVTGLNRPTGRAQQNGLELELQQPQPQHLSGLGADTPSVPPGRTTVRSSSTGSSAAAHAAAAAAGCPGANSAPVWEHLRAVRQHQWQLMQQQQQPQQLPAQQQSLLRVQQPFRSGGAAVTVGSFLTESFPIPETGNTQGPHDTLQSKPFSTAPFLESSPGVMLVGPLSRTAIGWEAPATSTASAAQPSPPCPATPTGPGGSPTTSPSITAAAAATTAIRLSLSPAVSSGGSSSSVQSPRAPPAMPDIPDTNPWDSDAMDGPSQPTAVMATPAPAPLALALGPAWGRLDASLLKPVLGRRLLPMPSPSRIISSAAATPRGSAGGAGASTGWAGAGMMLMRTSAASTAVQLSPERSSPQPGAVNVAMAHVASVSAGPSPPHTVALQVPEPCRTHLTDSLVLPPYELRPPAFNATAGSPSAISVTSFAGMQVDSGGQVSPGGVASATSPQSGASSTAFGRVERPLDCPGTWSSPLVRSPSAMCDSRSNSDGEGPNDEVT